MKRCPNSNCDSSFVFGNDKEYCPFCHSRLIGNTNEQRNYQPVISPDRVVFREQETDERTNNGFIRERSPRIMECHGRITEIDHQELFNGRWHKLINSLFRGEPYQLAHQTVEYTIRVENISDNYPPEVTDFCLYGSYLGRLQVGDEVYIRAKNQGNRRIVKKIFNETVGGPIKPSFQLPSSIIRGLFISAISLIVLAVCFVVWLFKSGAFMSGVFSLITYLLPIIIIFLGFWFMFRCILPRRRR